MPTDFAFQMVSVVAGAIGGALLGVAGGIGGTLARRGERPRWVGMVFGIVMALGGVTAITGLAAAGLNQPTSTWLGLIVIGVALIVFTRGIHRQLEFLRSQAPSSRLILPDDVNKSR